MGYIKELPCRIKTQNRKLVKKDQLQEMKTFGTFIFWHQPPVYAFFHAERKMFLATRI